MNTENKFYFGKHGQPERFSRIDSMLSDASAYVADGSDEASGILSDLIREKNRGTLSPEQVKYLSKLVQEARAMGVFSRPGQPKKFRRATDDEIENLLLEAESLIDDGFPSKAIPFLRKASNSIDMHTDAKLKKVLADLMREANVRFSCPGQPTMFAASPEQLERIRRRYAELKALPKKRVFEIYLQSFGGRLDYSHVDSREFDKPGMIFQIISREEGADNVRKAMNWSRPGQPEKFANVFLGGLDAALTSIELLIKQLRNAASKNDKSKALEIAKALRYKATNAETHVRAFMSPSNSPERFGLEDACWDGYEAVGTKQQDGRTVPNCVPMSKDTHAADDRSADFLRKMAVGVTPSNIKQMQIVVSQALAYGQGKRDTMLIEEAKAAQAEINELKKAGH